MALACKKDYTNNCRRGPRGIAATHEGNSLESGSRVVIFWNLDPVLSSAGGLVLTGALSTQGNVN